MTEPVQKNLYQKLSEISGSLGAVAKDSSAPAVMGGFKFTSYNALLALINQKLSDANVIIIPSGEELLHHEIVATQKGHARWTIVKHKFTVVNGDDKTERFEAYWIGEGQDSSDKGVQKAGTSALKYFLMKLFLVTDKEEKDSDAEKTDEVIAPSTPDGPTTQSRSVETSSNGTESTQDDALQPLLDLASSLPASKMWFPAKIKALVQAYDGRKRTGKLTDEDKEAGNAIAFVFNQIAATHNEVCGKDCPHILPVAAAIKLEGRVVSE
jgi:hypothetical protein